MRGTRSDPKLWEKVNRAILDENAAVAMVTLIDGMCSLLMAAGLANDVDGARIHLAAMVLSPDDGRPVGSLLPRLLAECDRIDD